MKPSLVVTDGEYCRREGSRSGASNDCRLIPTDRVDDPQCERQAEDHSHGEQSAENPQGRAETEVSGEPLALVRFAEKPELTIEPDSAERCGRQSDEDLLCRQCWSPGVFA